MSIEYIRNLFRGKRKEWVSISAYLKRHERDLKRDPSRFEREQEQARQWSVRVANKSSANEKES